MANSLERRVAKAERARQTAEDGNCDWAIVCADAGLGDEAAMAKVAQAARERWPSSVAATNLDPIAMLFWSAVLNGIISVPIMFAMMIVVSSQRGLRAFSHQHG